MSNQYESGEETEETMEHWQAKFREMEVKLKEVEQKQSRTQTTMQSPSRSNAAASSSSSNGEQSSGSTVVNVTTHQDSRTFQVIAANKMSHKAFQEMEQLLQEGRELSHYVDREAEQLIHIHLETMRFMDQTFKVTKDSPLTEIFAAMKKYHKADTILEKALHTAKHTYYEFAKDPKNTRLDSLETFQKFSIQLIQIQQKVEAERLPADQVENVVKAVKNNLGKSSRSGVKVPAVQAVRNKFDAIDQTVSAPKTLKEFQAMLGHFRFDCLEAMKTVEDMGLLGGR